jgi:hypothetical protein
VIRVLFPLLLASRTIVAQTGGREIIVDPRGPVTSIAAAMAMATDGDRVLVRPGTYREATILVRQSVTIAGIPARRSTAMENGPS